MFKIALIFWGCIAWECLLAQPAARLVTASGLPARDTGNQLTNSALHSTMANWMPPRVDERGRLFYQARVQETNASPTFKNAFFQGSPRRERYVMREGRGFPSISTGLTFGIIYTPSISPGGAIAFKTFLSGPEAGSSNEREALMAGFGDNLSMIARQGDYPDYYLDPENGLAGLHFSFHRIGAIQSFSMINRDYVLFSFSTKTNLNDTGFSSSALMLYSPSGYRIVYKSGMEPPGKLPVETYTTLRAYAMQAPDNYAWVARYQGTQGERVGVWRAAPILSMQVLDHGASISSNRPLRDVSQIWLTSGGASMYVLAAAEDSTLEPYFAWALGREDQRYDVATSNRTSTFTWLGEDHRPVPGRPDLIFTNSVDGQWASGSSFQQAGFALLDGGDMLVHAHAASNGAALSKEMIFRVTGTNFTALIAQGNAAPGGGTFDGFSQMQAMGSNHVTFIAATMRPFTGDTTYDLWYMRAEPGATPVKLAGAGDVFQVRTNEQRTVQWINTYSANRYGSVAAAVTFTDSSTGLLYVHAPGIAAPHMILSESLIEGTLPIEIPLGIPGYRLMEATSLTGDWTESLIAPELTDESLRWNIPLEAPGRYFRFEPEE